MKESISKTIIRVVVILGILGLAFVSYVAVASAQRVPPSQVARCNFSVRVGNETVVIDAKGIIINDRSDEWVVDFTDALDRRGLLDKGITGVQRVNANQCIYVR